MAEWSSHRCLLSRPPLCVSRSASLSPPPSPSGKRGNTVTSLCRGETLAFVRYNRTDEVRKENPHGNRDVRHTDAPYAYARPLTLSRRVHTASCYVAAAAFDLCFCCQLSAVWIVFFHEDSDPQPFLPYPGSPQPHGGMTPASTHTHTHTHTQTHTSCSTAPLHMCSTHGRPWWPCGSPPHPPTPPLPLTNQTQRRIRTQGEEDGVVSVCVCVCVSFPK